MHDVIHATKDLLHETKSLIKYYTNENIHAVATLVRVSLPLIGIGLYKVTGTLYSVILCLVIEFLISVMKKYGENKGKGTMPPLPSHRFTTAEESGEVTIEKQDINEMIIFMCEYEDWLEKTGKK